jgi:hypothetical protein
LPDVGKARHSITIKSPASNGVLGTVYVGNANVTSTTGLEFPAGAQKTLHIENTAGLWAIPSADNTALTLLVA